jgi:hypothetical protein
MFEFFFTGKLNQVSLLISKKLNLFHLMKVFGMYLNGLAFSYGCKMILILERRRIRFGPKNRRHSHSNSNSSRKGKTFDCHLITGARFTKLLSKFPKTFVNLSVKMSSLFAVKSIFKVYMIKV